jgi:hypothetical protein
MNGVLLGNTHAKYLDNMILFQINDPEVRVWGLCLLTWLNNSMVDVRQSR